LRDDVPFHGGVEVFAFRTRLQIQRSSEREDLKIIAVSARRRLWAAVANVAKVVFALDRAIWRTAFRDMIRLRIDISNKPMGEKTGGRIWIVHNNGESFGIRRDVFDSQLGAYVLTVLAELLRNRSALLECRARNFHFPASIGKCDHSRGGKRASEGNNCFHISLDQHPPI
jgi:hypothetical protein